MTARRTPLLLGALAAAVLGIALAVLLWLRPATPPPAPVLVDIEGQSYSAADFERFVGREARFATEREAEKAIDAFVDNELLLRAARSAGHESVGEWIASGIQVSDAEIERYYRDHLSDYVAPPRVRLAYFHVPKGDDPDAEWKQIQGLHIEAQLDRDPEAFQRLVAMQREGVLAGEVGPVPCDAAALALPAEVLEAGCRLRRWGISHPIATPEGFFVVRKTAQLPPRSRSLASERARIRALLAHAVEQDARRRQVQELRAGARVQVHAVELAKLVSPEPPPRAPSESPTPPRPPGLSGGAT